MTQTTSEKVNKQTADKISAELVSMAAQKAALNVPGVHQLCDRLTDNLARIITSKDFDDTGIRMSKDKDDELLIDIYLIAAFGVKIPQLAWDVQTAVKSAVEDISHRKVKCVNIHIQGVNHPQEGSEE